MKTNSIIVTILTCFFLSSCNDYLDVTPKGYVIPSTVEDFDLLLNGDIRKIHTTGGAYNTTSYTADDWIPTRLNFDFPEANRSNIKFLSYTWDIDLFNTNNQNDLWNLSYTNIYTFNLVTNSVGDAQIVGNYKESDRERIKAEAKVSRAFEYWQLVNTFAKQYNSATAATDLGVPLVLEADVSQGNLKRATVQEIYDFMLNDVQTAIPHLPDERVNKVRFAKDGGYALLARIYLSMGDYENALVNANAALDINDAVQDYNGLRFFFSYVNKVYEQEQYTQRFQQTLRGPVGAFLDTEIVDLYDKDADLRFYLYLRKYGNDYVNKQTAYFNPCVSISEMLVTKAECLARLSSGVSQDAINTLNQLRVKRMRENLYTDLTTADFANKAELLQFALEERRRELVMTGNRLFDLKRLNLEPEFAKKTVHVVEDVKFELPAGDDNFVLPIPLNVLGFNPNMQQNPRHAL